MLGMLKTRIKQGCRTMPCDQLQAVQLPERYRGRPVSNLERIPLDMGRITFAPDGHTEYSANYKMATYNRNDLRLDAIEKNQECAIRAEIRKLFGRSLKLRQVSAGGCNACESDINVLNTPVYDLSRFGVQFVASPRHCDGIMVTGPITRNMKDALLDTYEAVPLPKIVIAVGTCAISGGIFSQGAEVSEGLDSLIPVDLFVPGCPPHPLTILEALLRTLRR